MVIRNYNKVIKDLTRSKLIILIVLVTTVMTFAQASINVNGKNAFVKREFIENNEKFTFAILGDKTNGGEFNWPIFDRAVEEINLLQPDFVIMIGDMIQGVTTDTVFINQMWREFRSHAENLDVPLYVLPGNHDISNEVMYDYWNEKIGLRYYSFVHNNSLFILLNSEEYKKGKDGQLGKEQLDFIEEQLDANKNVNQNFIFIHRPIWLKSDSRNGGYEEWQKVDSWIKNRNTTVFAGHWHNLVFNKIDGKRHIVLSATGGNLTEKPMPELGYFHHYSIVTVDKDTSVISYIKPGSIFPEDIANEKFINKFNNLVKVDNKMDVNENNVLLSSKISLNNQLDKNIGYTISTNNKENSYWEFNNNEITGNLKPNESVNYQLSSKNSIGQSIPLPNIEYAISIDGKLADTKTVSFAPSSNETWRFPNNVMVLGGFSLGFTQKPSTEMDIKNTQLSTEVDWESEQKYISEKLNDSYKWKEAEVIKGDVILDNYFDQIDFAFGFIKFIIESEKEASLLATIIPDNYAQVYLNEELVLDGTPFKGVPSNPYMFLLNLKKGENTVLIKTANYYGSWYIDFKVSDPQKILVFKVDK